MTLRLICRDCQRDMSLLIEGRCLQCDLEMTDLAAIQADRETIRWAAEDHLDWAAKQP